MLFRRSLQTRLFQLLPSLPTLVPCGQLMTSLGLNFLLCGSTDHAESVKTLFTMRFSQSI